MARQVWVICRHCGLRELQSVLTDADATERRRQHRPIQPVRCRRCGSPEVDVRA